MNRRLSPNRCLMRSLWRTNERGKWDGHPQPRFNEHSGERSARNEPVSSWGAFRSTKTKPHIECVEHGLEPRIPRYGQIHHSSKFTFDPDKFVRDPPKVATRAFKQDFDGLIGGGMRDEVESDGRHAWRGGRTECGKSSGDPEETSTRPTDLKFHFLDVWEFGKVEGPLGSLRAICIGGRY